MRPGQQKQRSRGRSSGGGGSNNNNNNNNNQRKGQNPLTRTYDSSGPDVKIRGTAQHIAEKYMALARDATSSGDRVMAENYLQHAEHYNRIIAAAQAMYQERFQRDERSEFNERQDYNERDDDDSEVSGNSNGEIADVEAPAPKPVAQPVVIDESTPQPVFEGTPAEVQVEEETSAQENAERAPARRRSAGRPRRAPRQSKTAEGDAQPDAEAASAPVDEPAE
ncbi:DUF4167 domain-containing protein [Rhizobium sp. KVB221]|uniref:DUF4167 domain-containing protein n=1 Tax=Rhizobium setariae TaxID=2801340 RepID=A0A936YVR1_9HYPH|nr:DUF4167 domain-containing protein [Rhizobium setariae]MBL0374731.1 DUF4167 domain-containing protein [Rhizobium setariae]